MHSLSLVVCFITILTSSACQVTDEAEKTSEPATCIYKGYEDEVYDLTSLANTNERPRFAFIMHTFLSFFLILFNCNALFNLVLTSKLLIEHVHEAECKV